MSLVRSVRGIPRNLCEEPVVPPIGVIAHKNGENLIKELELLYDMRTWPWWSRLGWANQPGSF